MLRVLLHGLCFAASISLACGGLSGAAAAQGSDPAAGRYVDGIPDLPLMPGLKSLPDSGLVFDKPSGRIVEAFAAGGVTAQSVVAFYDATLPQLGWHRETAGAYLREGERLSLDLGQDGATVTVHFRLFPQ
jgi:hypothetical protein